RQWPLVREVINGEQTAALVKALDGPSAGRWMIVRLAAGRVESLGDATLDDWAARAADAVMTEGASRLITLPGPAGEVRLFVEVLRPPVRLIICGAGHDAVPVVEFASALGWRTVIVDQRQRFLNPQRFPGAQRFIHAEPAAAADAVPIDDRTYVVVMTHNYLHDRDLLRGFLATPVRYIGMLGPRLRTEKILDALAASGTSITSQDRARIYGPIGLDIGGEGAEAIALALLAEIHAVEADRTGGLLRDRKGPIHATVR
ncbi:MAG TPA: XdhC family protein, partial [bacterium]